MSNQNEEIYWNSDRKMRFLFAVSGFAMFFALLYYLSDVLTPFIIAFLLAYILNPIVNLLQKKVKHRWLASIIVLMLVLIIFIGAVLIFVPMIVDQAMNLGRLLQKYASDSTWKATIMEYLPDEIKLYWDKIWEERNFAPLLDKLQNFDLLSIAQSAWEKVLPSAAGVFSGVGRVFAWFFALFMIALCLVFALIDFENIKKKMSNQIPEKYHESVLHFFSSFDHIMGNYFRAQTAVASIVGALFATAFSIMGLPMGLPFGLFIGVLNMVPYLQVASIPIAAFLGLIYSLESGIAYWEVALMIIVIYAGIQVLQDSVIVPRIMGGALGLSPVLILISLVVWGKLLGFLGLVLAIPFTSVVIATYKSFRLKGKSPPRSNHP